MKNIILSFLIGFLSIGVFAQTDINPSKAEKIDALINVLGSQDQYNAFINVGLENLVAKYGDQLSNADKKILKEESLDLVVRFLNTDMKAIYDKYLTEKELDDLIAFYSSETGKRFRQLQPMINAEINQIMMQKYMGEFKNIIAKRLTAGQ